MNGELGAALGLVDDGSFGGEGETITLPSPPSSAWFQKGGASLHVYERPRARAAVSMCDTDDLRSFGTGVASDWSEGTRRHCSKLIIERYEADRLVTGTYVTPGRWDLSFEVSHGPLGAHQIVVGWRSGTIYEQITGPKGDMRRLFVFDADILAMVAGDAPKAKQVEEFLERRDHEAASYLRVLDLFEAIRRVAPGPFERNTLAAMDLILEACATEAPRRG